MRKTKEMGVTDGQNKKRAQVWYEQMDRQFQEDSKLKDFSLCKEWDEDFQRAMFGETSTKAKNHRKLAYVAAGVAAVVIAGFGVSQKEVIGDSLEEIFSNQSNSTDSEVDHFGTKEEMSAGENEYDKVVVYADKTLTEVYAQIRDILKRPFFQVQDDFGEYEIDDVVYVSNYDMIIIQLSTNDGRIFISQRSILDNTVVGTKTDENSKAIWNENLKQNIVINKSVQDDSYMFSAKMDYVVFSFSGYVSEEKCIEIAENLSFK